MPDKPPLDPPGQPPPPPHQHSWISDGQGGCYCACGAQKGGPC